MTENTDQTTTRSKSDKGWMQVIKVLVIPVLVSIAAMYLIAGFIPSPRFLILQTPTLIVQNPSSDTPKSKITLTTNPDGDARMLFTDATGQTRLTLQTKRDGASTISIGAPNAKADLISIDTDREGFRPRIMLRDPKRSKIVWSVAVGEDGLPIIEKVMNNN